MAQFQVLDSSFTLVNGLFTEVAIFFAGFKALEKNVTYVDLGQVRSQLFIICFQTYIFNTKVIWFLAY